jgi:hypothetical protein
MSQISASSGGRPLAQSLQMQRALLALRLQLLIECMDRILFQRNGQLPERSTVSIRLFNVVRVMMRCLNDSGQQQPTQIARSRSALSCMLRNPQKRSNERFRLQSILYIRTLSLAGSVKNRTAG